MGVNYRGTHVISNTSAQPSPGSLTWPQPSMCHALQLRYYCRGNFECKRSDQLLVMNKEVWLTKPYMYTCNIVRSGCGQNEVGSIVRTKLATGSVPKQTTGNCTTSKEIKAFFQP